MNSNLTIISISNSLTPFDNIRTNIKITYQDLHILTNALSDDSILLENSNLILIYNIIKSTDNQSIMFKFLCSSDCNEGKNFVNEEITKMVMKFIKIISSRDKTILEFADHSLSSLVKNWDNDLFCVKCPINILDFTICGEFTLKTTKYDLLSSVHNILINIGLLSETEEIVIKFKNMGGTIVYSIADDNTNINVRVLSRGNSSGKVDIFNINSNNTDTHPVHSEFKLDKCTISISITHWSNLELIETPISLPELRRLTTEIYGDENNNHFIQYNTSNKRSISGNIKKLILTDRSFQGSSNL
jgi:uncharacterized protein YqfB (UPF0267 family)